MMRPRGDRNLRAWVAEQIFANWQVCLQSCWYERVFCKISASRFSEYLYRLAVNLGYTNSYTGLEWQRWRLRFSSGGSFGDVARTSLAALMPDSGCVMWSEALEGCELMAEITVTLPYGREMVEVKIPRANLVGVYSPRDFKPVTNVKDEIIRAINNPIASKPATNAEMRRYHCA